MEFKIVASIFAVSLLMSCGSTAPSEKKEEAQKTVQKVEVPTFDAQIAYDFVAAQVAFGPRVPGTPAQKKCADYLAAELKKSCDNVIVQHTDVRSYDNKLLPCYNIIGQINSNNQNRIMLCSHWDSRHVADQDPLPYLRNQPVLGANDGASGVGVLLEIARLLKATPANIGVDIIFLDCEDYGTPEDYKGEYQEDSWCLGTQYWAANLHVPNYYARYGILLDMVGAPEATFYQEAFSNQVAPQIVKKVWDTAAQLGFTNYFRYEEGGMITDDHVYVNKVAKIPCIDIIHYDVERNSFGKNWHTTHDNMEWIDKKTLNAVGQTLLQVIYSEE